MSYEFELWVRGCGTTFFKFVSRQTDVVWSEFANPEYTIVTFQEMVNYKLRPSYEYQADPWKYFSIDNKTASECTRKKKNFKEIIK